MQIDMTEQVALYIANEESLYMAIREFMQDCYDDDHMDDCATVEALYDFIEIEVRDVFLSGTETPAGDWLIRKALDSVGWYALAQSEYSDFLSDMGDDA